MSNAVFSFHVPKVFPEKMIKICLVLAIAFLIAAFSSPLLSHAARAGTRFQPQFTDSSKGLEITSDRLDYCFKLDRILTRKLLHPHSIPVGIMEDVRILQSRGMALCTHGHIRGGIERLRRGLVLLKTYRKRK